MLSRSNSSSGLDKYFTDREEQLESFQGLIGGQFPNNRILFIHGIGGVGKSALLEKYCAVCKGQNIPVGLVRAGEATDAVKILSNLAKDLSKSKEVELRKFGEISHELDKYLTDTNELLKKVFSSAVQVGGTLVEGSLIPFGPLVVPAITEFVERIRPTHPRMELWLNPVESLTEAFMKGISAYMKKGKGRRLVLMLDEYERIEETKHIDRWVETWIRQLLNVEGVVIVIAGRSVPEWLRFLAPQVQVIKLEPMEPEFKRELASKYLESLQGKPPDPQLVEQVVGLTSGLPLEVVLVAYYLHHAPNQVPMAMLNVEHRLLGGLQEELVTMVKAAATLRWFDKTLLEAVLGQQVGDNMYYNLCRLPFIQWLNIDNIPKPTVHEVMREIVKTNLETHDQRTLCTWHRSAAEHFKSKLSRTKGALQERSVLEWLYHSVLADEGEGIQKFTEVAEELVRSLQINRLRTVMSDANTYPLKQPNSLLWLKYYNARLAHLEGRHEEAQKAYSEITASQEAEERLRAYALCDSANLLFGRRIGTDEERNRVLTAFNQSLSNFRDSKTARGLIDMARVYRDMGDWENAWKSLNSALEYYNQLEGHYYDKAYVHLRFQSFHAYEGSWKKMFDAHEKAVDIASNIPNYDNSGLKADILSHLKVAWIWSGRYSEAERELRKSLELWSEIIGPRSFLLHAVYRDLGLVLAFEGKEEEALENLNSAFDVGKDNPRERGVTLGFYGIALMRMGRLKEAKDKLEESLQIKRDIQDTTYLAETLNWLGMLYEMTGRNDEAKQFFQEGLDSSRSAGRQYFRCGALTGLIRVKHAQGNYDDIPPLLKEAEQLANQYEYNDHLASLRLSQGHIAWEGKAPSWENGFDAALHYYQQALIYALRYNRFLLDEVLSGRLQGTPLRPVIPFCLQRGNEGREMLQRLHDWWQTGCNDVGMPRTDTISLIQEGIKLRDAETAARQREPGDGSPQKSVVEQIEEALQSASAH